MITAEFEPLGGFIGDAFVDAGLPGRQLLITSSSSSCRTCWLGLAAIALYPMQGWLIPKLQRKVNQLGKQRVRTVRQLAGPDRRIGRRASSRSTPTTPSRYERADFAHRLGRIYDIRFEIFQRKFFIKFLNNFLAQLTPFFFYPIGGYLVIRGELSLGALVAVLAAYKDLASPWKELLDSTSRTRTCGSSTSRSSSSSSRRA